MVRFHYDKSAAGVGAGYTKSLPDSLAAELVRLGIGHIEKKADMTASNNKVDNVSTQPVKAAKSAPKRTKKQSN